MPPSTFPLSVSFSQVALFVSTLSKPFNDWTEAHVLQGFAWRDGSVSFRTLEESGVHFVTIVVTDRLGPPADDVVRAIDVPFRVPTDGAVEVASIADSVPISLPPGTYCLRYELLRKSGDKKDIRFTFARSGVPRFAVVRTDSELAPDVALLTNAKPASG